MASLAEKLQKLRESEFHVVTGPPNAASVDFLKKTEGYFQDEIIKFSKVQW